MAAWEHMFVACYPLDGVMKLTPVIQRLVGKVHLQHVDVLGLVPVAPIPLASDAALVAAHVINLVVHFSVVGDAVAVGRRLVDVPRFELVAGSQTVVVADVEVEVGVGEPEKGGDDGE